MISINTCNSRRRDGEELIDELDVGPEQSAGDGASGDLSSMVTVVEMRKSRKSSTNGMTACWATQ